MLGFDPRIELGTLLNFIGMVIAGIIFVMKIRQDLQSLETKINERLSAVETKVNIILVWWQKKIDPEE